MTGTAASSVSASWRLCGDFVLADGRSAELELRCCKSARAGVLRWQLYQYFKSVGLDIVSKETGVNVRYKAIPARM